MNPHCSLRGESIISNMSDNEVIRQILKGERDMYRILVERYQQMVFRTCLGFIHNKEDADDLTQDIFIQAYQSLSGFKGDATFSTWIYRIAINASLNRVRKTSRNFILQRFDTFFSSEKGREMMLQVSDTDNPENILIRDEHRKWIQEALNSLPDKQRTAIVLSKYDNLMQKEIALIMNTTEGAVEALIQRAKVNLRKKLSSLQKK